MSAPASAPRRWIQRKEEELGRHGWAREGPLWGGDRRICVMHRIEHRGDSEVGR
jgi:hypothetical protein